MISTGLAEIRRRGFRPIFCNHPECPYEDCIFNQMYISIDDDDIWYIDLKCERYLDI